MPKALKITPKKKPAKKAAKKIAKNTIVPKGVKPLKKKVKSHALGRSTSPPVEKLAGAAVLDRLWNVIESRKSADPATSHSARLLSRGTAKVAQKFGEEAVECLIEAVAGNRKALVAESADVIYHLLVIWVNAGIAPVEIWAELVRREGVSGIVEKAARPIASLRIGTAKIP